MAQFKALAVPVDTSSLYFSVIFSSLNAHRQDDTIFYALFKQLIGDFPAKAMRLQREFIVYDQTGAIPSSLIEYIKPDVYLNLATQLRNQGITFLDAALHVQIEESAKAIEQGQVTRLVQETLSHCLQVQIQVYTQTAQHLTLHRVVGTGTAVIQILEESGRFQPLIDVTRLNSTQMVRLESNPTFILLPRSARPTDHFAQSALQVLARETMSRILLQLRSVSTSVPVLSPSNDIISAMDLRLVRASSDLPIRDASDPLGVVALARAFEGRVVLVDGQPVETIGSWAASLSRGTVAGAAAGTLGIGMAYTGVEVATAFAEVVVGGVGGAALSIICVPVFVTCTIVALIVSVAGKTFAQEYKEAIQAAHRLMNEGRYAEAAEKLEQQFNRFILVRASRFPFLSRADYAVAHFFNGMCAEMLPHQIDIKKAYDEYTKALNEATGAQLPLVSLLLRVKLVQLLREHSHEVSGGEEPRVLMKRYLKELNLYFKDSLTHLYHLAWSNMVTVATEFNQLQDLTPEGIARIRGVLDIKSLFLLDGYENGRGNFLMVFHAFFKTLVIVHAQFNRPELLEKLFEKLDLGSVEHTDRVFCMVLNLLAEVFASWGQFRREFPKLAHERSFQNCYDMMATFAKQYGGLVFSRIEHGGNPALPTRLSDLAEKLQIQEMTFKDIARKQQQLEMVLGDVEAQFGVHFESISAWLQALVNAQQTDFKTKSSQTGNTMLHLLATLPPEMAAAAQVQAAVKNMQGLKFIRNRRHQTPLSLLAHNDPYAIGPCLIESDFVSLGTQFQQVEHFVNSVYADPNRGHLLLLHGPSGTGKTQTVLTQLRSKGYQVVSWEKSSQEDQFVNQMVHRVSEFFRHVVVANPSSGKCVIVFIDNIDSVCPQTSGEVREGHHSQKDVVVEFEKQIDALKGKRVVVIGATKSPERLSEGIQSRATSIMFTLPDKVLRERLFTHLLYTKVISPTLVDRLVQLTQGWSPGQIALMIGGLKKETEVDESDLARVYDQRRTAVETEFRGTFPCARLMLPTFVTTPPHSEYVVSPAVATAFDQIKAFLKSPEDFRGALMHTLFYGPPGSGKTTAMREFAKKVACPFMLIEKGVTRADFIAIFARAGMFRTVIVCIDEVDVVASEGSPVKEFLQEQMDGFQKSGNNYLVLMGATNYPGRLAEPIFDRFTKKVMIPLPSLEERGDYIKKVLEKEATDFRFDPALTTEMTTGCLRLSRLSGSLSYRALNSVFGQLLGTLRSKELTSQPLTLSSIEDCMRDALQGTREAVEETFTRSSPARGQNNYSAEFFKGMQQALGGGAGASPSPHS